MTLETSTSLLRRHDVAGLQIVAEALADADGNHRDWIRTAVEAVLGIYANERNAAVSSCSQLKVHPDRKIRAGTDDLLTVLGQITPVLMTRIPG